MKHLSKNVQRVLAAALMAVLLVGVAAGASTVTKKTVAPWQARIYAPEEGFFSCWAIRCHAPKI